MIIDVIFFVVVVVAFIKGLSRGLIVGVFSLLAFIIGLAAATKLSVVVADYLKDTVNVSSKWLPVISFVLVFLVVALLVRWVAKLIQASVEFAMLGWVNRLGGALFFIALYAIIFSVFLFFAVHIKLLSQKTIDDSVCYPVVARLGPSVIDAIGKIVPAFRNMFGELQDFFGNLARKVPA